MVYQPEEVAVQLEGGAGRTDGHWRNTRKGSFFTRVKFGPGGRSSERSRQVSFGGRVQRVLCARVGYAGFPCEFCVLSFRSR